MGQDDFRDGGDRRRIEVLEAEVRALRNLATLGRLASGVAHDFNNQLTSILGYADLLLGTSVEGEAAHEDLLEIRRAAERATVITQQLLAFARPHTAQPGFVNLADIVMDIVRLLRRVFGPDIQLTTSLPAEPVVVQVDPVHIGHALLHLALYARDTLPQGGTLTFELSGADLKRDAGSRELVSELLARLNIRAGGPPRPAGPQDSAAGPPGAASPPPAEAEPASRALDTVVHLLEQNGGRFQIARDSETSGTFVAMLQFPSLTADAHSIALRSVPPRGHETIMVVEDDSAVRTLMRTLLERHGYRVMVAEGPRDALATASVSAPSIDLLIVDVVLRDAPGDALAADIQRLRTGVRLLYISGQSDALAADRPPLAPAGILLAKPFTPNRLLLAVRQALDTTPDPARWPSS
jgi:two-component system cell cycle sensor histidine kinase/response regulator CckA